MMSILDLGNPTTVSILLKAFILNGVIHPETEMDLQNMPYFNKLNVDNSFYTNRWLGMGYSDILTLREDFSKQQNGNKHASI